mmetsp:Transcript_48512/g.136474  ORF Transcript_48512/g.136474 Transcript_48512/m.136474 type:complete len:294 (+) Transcript_48512:59-940(+)
MAMTDVVHAVLPMGVNLAATHLAFQRYGDVASVEPAAVWPGRAAVTFYDVRSAARAVEALGWEYCTPAPPSSDRSVPLPGSVELDAEDLELVASVSGGSDGSGRYAVEFYDVRDAVRFAERLGAAQRGAARGDVTPPPGLMPPPGLDTAVDVGGSAEGPSRWDDKAADLPWASPWQGAAEQATPVAAELAGRVAMEWFASQFEGGWRDDAVGKADDAQDADFEGRGHLLGCILDCISERSAPTADLKLTPAAVSKTQVAKSLLAEFARGAPQPRDGCGAERAAFSLRAVGARG